MGLSLMSKGNKKRSKKNNTKKENQKYVMNNTEKLEIFIYYFQYLLLILGIIGLIVGILLLAVSYYFSLSIYYKTCFITVILSIIILFNWYTFGKFIEVRGKYGKKKEKKK